MRPRALVHRGHIEASGLCFDARWVETIDLRRRVLAHARGATTVLALDDAFIVRFAIPRRLDADRCEATPLVADGACLLALPLRPAERAALDLDRVPALVRAREGRALVQPLAGARVVDLAEWLDVEAWTAVPVATLGATPTIARAVLVAGAAGTTDARTILGGAIPPPSAERDALLDALAGQRPHRDERGGSIGGWLGGIGKWLGEIFTPAPREALPQSHGSAPPRPLAPPGPLRKWLERLVIGSPLARVIGKRQAEYLGKTLRMFEEGDFDQALRHAVPMSSMPGSGESKTSLSVPTPRAGLELRPGHVGTSSSIHLGEDALTHIRTIYRNAARELELKGRYEEAAFVLFELLGNDDAGVAMLERHGQYELAARMAEGRGLAAGGVIRLWFLAGKPAEAVRVARRTGAFADAITRLERGHPAYAARLRLLWGERLAEAGEYAAAVDAVWPVADARRLARRWLDLAIGFGGPTAARLIPRKLALVDGEPVGIAEVQDAVLAIVGDDSPDGTALRHMLAHAWPQSEAAAGPARTLGRVLCRRIMLDAHAKGMAPFAAALRDKLGDPLFVFDGATPKLAPPAPPASARSGNFEAHERGLQPIADVVALPGGRYLLALGEAGVRLVDRDGRTLRHYEHPATRLLLAESGSRVVTVIRRGAPDDAPATLGRIDLVSGKAQPWCDARFLHDADSHDGAEWYLAEHDAVACIDVQAPGMMVLWRVSQLPGRVLALARSRTRLSFALAHEQRSLVEIWTYHLEGGERRLERRHPVTLPLGTSVAHASISPAGALVLGLATNDDAREKRLLAWSPSGTFEARRDFPIAAALRESSGVVCIGDDAGGCTIRTLAYDSLGVGEPWLTLRGTPAARIRFQGDHVLVCDDRGRVIALDHDGRTRHWLLVP